LRHAVRPLHVPALRFVPLEVRPEFGRSRAASLAHEQRLKIGQPDIIGPSIRTDRCPMAAVIVRAIDQQANWPRRRRRGADHQFGRMDLTKFLVIGDEVAT